MALKTAPFDAAEVLDTEEAIEEFIAAAFETEDPAFIARALGTVTRARNMTGHVGWVERQRDPTLIGRSSNVLGLRFA